MKICLIGMCGCGKTTTGQIMSKMVNTEFCDLDKYIEKKQGMRLQQLIDEKGDQEFTKIEGQAFNEIVKNHSDIILATGGSIVYSDMNEAWANGWTTVYIRVPYKVLEKRTDAWTNRGIVFLGKTPKELFNERALLYSSAADLEIETDGKEKAFDVAKKILHKVKSYLVSKIQL